MGNSVISGFTDEVTRLSQSYPQKAPPGLIYELWRKIEKFFFTYNYLLSSTRENVFFGDRFALTLFFGEQSDPKNKKKYAARSTQNFSVLLTEKGTRSSESFVSVSLNDFSYNDHFVFKF